MSKKGSVLGYGQTSPLLVQFPDEEKVIDVESWDDVSVSGSVNEIFDYLASHNMQRTDLTRIFWRLKDRKFFLRLTQMLRSRSMFAIEIWQYCIEHQSLIEFQEYIQCGSILKSFLEPYFYSPWLTYDALQAKGYSHLEYFPLINARVHKLGIKRKINNDRLREQYQQYLNRCLFLAAPSVMKLPFNIILEAVYYLLLQDRLQEAIQIFQLIDNKNNGRMMDADMKTDDDSTSLVISSNINNSDIINDNTLFQYSYIRAYLNFFDESDVGCKIARNIIKEYQNIPLPINKRQLLNDIELQLSEIAEAEDIKEENEFKNDEKTVNDRNQTLMIANANVSKIEPHFDFEIHDRNIKLVYFDVQTISVDFYKMDIELLFSMSPFLHRGQMGSSKDADVFSYISPNMSMMVDLPSVVNENGTAEEEGKNADGIGNQMMVHNIAVPHSLQNDNIYVQCRALNISTAIAQTFYDHRLLLQIKDRFGRIRVLDRTNMKGIRAAYVKVYAWIGSAKFHKDGYTDRRGDFDYVSVSCDHLLQTTKFAVLICTPNHGSVVRIIDIPPDLL